MELVNNVRAFGRVSQAENWRGPGLPGFLDTTAFATVFPFQLQQPLQVASLDASYCEHSGQVGEPSPATP